MRPASSLLISLRRSLVLETSDPKYTIDDGKLDEITANDDVLRSLTTSYDHQLGSSLSVEYGLE